MRLEKFQFRLFNVKCYIKLRIITTHPFDTDNAPSPFSLTIPARYSDHILPCSKTSLGTYIAHIHLLNF
jgi:hypothetical protein